jgi:hypothetical protein
MIKLKSEVNKSTVMREIRKEAEKMYDGCYEKELRIEAYIRGAEMLFDLLRLSNDIKTKQNEK